MAITIELLTKQKMSGIKFDCGEEALNNYILKQAKQDMKRHVCATYVLLEDSSLLGYYTLSSTIIHLDQLSGIDGVIAKKLPKYPYLPATLLGRLAVKSETKGKGYGQLLLVNALTRTYVNSSVIGSIAVVVDAKNKEAMNFYKRYGFLELRDNQLFMTMDTIKEVFE
ncbi:GNAT family N-acetyltransferase [Caedibacter taeniospiralis]|uniref:GNAT family N-acetyltransferase n=1 Tax=Caedibacter taeniospiralis TaxID=28907 RepID=UPI000C2811C6|nr:GNAT family N-acetyltransferase [Caedibacter taeniospiralis]